MSPAQKSARSSASKSTTYEGFTDDERGAMKDRAKELKAAVGLELRESTD